MSPLASPVLASTSTKIGTSISTPLVVPSPRRTTGDWAKPMTATSVTVSPGSLASGAPLRHRLPSSLVASLLTPQSRRRRAPPAPSRCLLVRSPPGRLRGTAFPRRSSLRSSLLSPGGAAPLRLPHGAGRPLQVVGVALVGRVRLAGGVEVVDVLRRRAPLVPGLPERPDPHAHPDLARFAAQDQVLERDVGAVEKYRGGHVGRGDPLPGIRDINHTERRDGT